MYEYKTGIFVHHTDVTGRLFYGALFYLVHEAKERMLEELGFAIPELVEHPKWTFPLIHAEADYKIMLKAGDRITIRSSIEKIGVTSVVFAFSIFKADGSLAATAKSVSVAVDLSTGKKTPVPADWRRMLEKALVAP